MYKMPHPAAFLAGFGLRRGAKFAGFTLSRVDATHETVSRYHTYAYHITLVFVGGGSYESLYDAVVDGLSGSREIRSQYGNPYECYIDAMREGDVAMDGDAYIFHLVGHAERVYH